MHRNSQKLTSNFLGLIFLLSPARSKLGTPLFTTRLIALTITEYPQIFGNTGCRNKSQVEKDIALAQGGAELCQAQVKRELDYLHISVLLFYSDVHEPREHAFDNIGPPTPL